MGGPKTPGNFVQDGPPKGGYPTVNVRRNLPGGGMSSLALFGTCCATFCYGMYTIIQANRTRRAISTEDRDIRMSIVPFLQTEADVQSAFVQEKLKQNEAEFMKDVPGWVAGEGVYKTRYMAPMSVYGINHGR